MMGNYVDQKDRSVGRFRRRQFLVGAGALLAAGAARTQTTPRVHRVGVIFNQTPGYSPLEKIFVDELRRLRFEEGKNLLVERRYAEGKRDRFPEIARDLVRLNVDLIVANSNTAAFAALGATRTIPIVAVMGKPVEYGLIKSHAHPGGNLTGVDMVPSVDLEQKCVEILKAAIPAATRAARLGYTGAWKPGLYGQEYARKIFELTGLSLISFDVGGRPDEIDGALEKIAASRPDVLHVYGHEILFPHFPKIAEFAAKRGIPSISESVFYAPSGGLLYYGTNPVPQMKRLAAFVARVLRGAKPSELPVEQPTEFELVLNKRVADAMGVKLPQSFLVRVDRVVE